MPTSPWFTPPTQITWSGWGPGLLAQPTTGSSVSAYDDTPDYWTTLIDGTAPETVSFIPVAEIMRQSFPEPATNHRWTLGQRITNVPMRSAWDWTFDLGTVSGKMLPYYLPGEPGFVPPPDGPYDVEFEGAVDENDPAAGTLVPGGQQLARVRIVGSFPTEPIPLEELGKAWQLAETDPGISTTDSSVGIQPYRRAASTWQTKARLDTLEGAGRLMTSHGPISAETVEVPLAFPVDPDGTLHLLSTVASAQATSNAYEAFPDFSLLLSAGCEVGIEYQPPRYRFVTDVPQTVAPLRQRQRDDQHGRHGRSKQRSIRQGWAGTYL